MSTTISDRTALEPQRLRGKQRVAALMEAAAAVIAEKGFEAATMAEVAARAGAPIGSLYRFFPNKEVLADALIQRYGELIKETFAQIDAQITTLSIEALTDTLLGVVAALHRETKVILALLDAHADWSGKRDEFRNTVLRHIAQTLRLRCPSLSPDAAKNIAVVLLHNMKTMAAFTVKQRVKVPPGAVTELCEMTRLYLADRLGDDR